MTTDNINNELSRGSSNYAEILRHAVAVIEHARTEIARHVNGYVSTAYWEIGQMLHDCKIESGYGDSVVRRLSVDFKKYSHQYINEDPCFPGTTTIPLHEVPLTILLVK